jgi:hypothetical protein
MTARLLLALALLGALGAPVCAWAVVDEGEVKGEHSGSKGATEEAGPKIQVSLLGGYRAAINVLEPYPMDRQGTLFEQRVYLDHRLRFSPEIQFGDRVAIGVEVDLLTGMLGGSTPDATLALDERLRWDAAGARYAEVRQAYLRLRGRPVGMVLGLTTDHWGLGAMAHDGGPVAVGFSSSPFGTDHFGDRSLRVGFELPPAMDATGAAAHTNVDLFIDVVARDDETRLFVRGDLVLVPGVRIQYLAPDARAGVWVGWRTRRDRDGGVAEVFQGDVYVDRTATVGPRDATFRIAAEGVGRVGRSNLSNGWPDPQGRLVTAGAAVLEAEVDLAGLAPVLGLRGGIASGDATPGDERDTGMRLDRDYNAGVILFDEVLAGFSARRAVQLYDDLGVDGVPAADEGAISGAAFCMPYVAFSPHRVVTVRLGGLVAAATVDPLYLVPSEGDGVDGTTVQAGGRFYGGELDASVELNVPLLPGAQPRMAFGLRVEYGHLFPGPALTCCLPTPVPEVDRLGVQLGVTF